MVPLTSQIRSQHYSLPQKIHPISYVVLTSSLLPISNTIPSTSLQSSVYFTKMMHHVSPHPSQQQNYISTISDYKSMGGGATEQLPKNRAYLHIYWEITTYKIGGIGDSILCTGKGIFHLICEDGSIIPITIFHCAEATEQSFHPPMLFSATQTLLTAGGK